MRDWISCKLAITVARLYMKEQNTQKHILLDSLDSKKM